MFNQVALAAALFSSIFILSLGVLVWYHRRHSATNIIFLSFCFAVSLYTIINYLSFSAESTWALLLVRLTIFSAVPHTVLFFLFVRTFPSDVFNLDNRHLILILFLTLCAMILCVTPFVFKEIIIQSNGLPPVPVVRGGMGIVMFVIVGGALLGIVEYFRKFKTLHDRFDRQHLKLIGSGFLITLILLIIFNLFGPVIFHVTTTIPFSPIFILPFILLSGYAVLRNNALGVKVIYTEFFVLFILDLFIIEALLETKLIVKIIKLVFSLGAGFLGFLLVRSVYKEVKQREKVTELANSLKTANLRLQELDRQKTDFLSIAAHQK